MAVKGPSRETPEACSTPLDALFSVRPVLFRPRPDTLCVLERSTLLVLLSRRVDEPCTVTVDVNEVVFMSNFGCAVPVESLNS